MPLSPTRNAELAAPTRPGASHDEHLEDKDGHEGGLGPVPGVVVRAMTVGRDTKKPYAAVAGVMLRSNRLVPACETFKAG